jgi:ferrochelatase
MKKTAVILFNLGGPSSLGGVESFLFNLFYDKAIINLPNPIRWILAKLLSVKRKKTAQEIYSQIGGKSPILEETKKQAVALESVLQNIKIFISMRYTFPDSKEVAQQIKKYNPENIIFLPLYPQFSTTTTASSIKDMREKLQEIGFKGNINTICCYYSDENFIDAHIENIKKTLTKLRSKNYRILFSAHSLPEKIIKQGDPYQWQIEETTRKIVEKLAIKNLDYKITYQSKVTPVKWLEPNTEDEIVRACRDKKSIVIVPIAFVSEHSETLVELDIEYAKIAAETSTEYLRVPALGSSKKFIHSLEKIIKSHLVEKKNIVTSNKKTRICPRNFNKCVCKE